MAGTSGLARHLAGCWALVAGLAACTTGPDIDGVWHADVPVSGSSNTLIWSKPQPGVELVIGSYGPDISGLIRYYRSGQFERPRAPQKPWQECECGFLHQARVDNAGRVTFELNACVPGSSPTTPLALRGELRLMDDGRLVGVLAVDDPSRPALAGASAQVTFVRVAATGSSDPAILDCQHPASLADGNTASGL